MGCGLWVVGCGLWVVGCGLWVVGCGLWVVDCVKIESRYIFLLKKEMKEIHKNWRKHRFRKFLIGLGAGIFLALIALNLHFTAPLHHGYSVVDEDENVIEVEVVRTVQTEEQKQEKRVVPKRKLLKEIIEIEMVENEADENVEEFQVETPFEQPLIEVAAPKPPVPPAPPLPEEDGPVVFAEYWPALLSCKGKNHDPDEKKNCTVEQIRTHLIRHIRYPHVARENRIEGTVVLSIVIDKDGGLESVVIERDIGAGCGAEALRVMEMLDEWTPAINNGHRVKFKMFVPVKFQLQ